MRQMTEAAVRDSAGMSRTFFYYINIIFEKNSCNVLSAVRYLMKHWFL